MTFRSALGLPAFASVVAIALAGVLGCASTPSAAQAPSAPPPQPPGPIRHVIVVTVDGLKPESYLAPDAHGLHIPILRHLVSGGASSDGARSVFPSVTYPAHTSIASGVTPGRHGIVTNRAFDPLERNQEGWRWYAEDVKVPRLWDLATDAGYSSAVINWPVTVGARATYLVPEVWRAGTLDDKKLVRALSTPGLLDAVGKAFPGFDQRWTEEGFSDQGKTDVATYLIEKASPNVLFLHLTEVDSAQHKRGLWSAEALAAIENSDRQLGRLLEATQRSGNTASTALIVASDHGFVDVSRLVRPGALLRQAGLVQLDDKGKVSGWSANILPNGGSLYVYLKDPQDPTLQATTLKVLEDKAREPEGGLGRVLRHEQIVAMGGDPDAFLALDAAPNTTFGAGYSGDYDAPISVKAMHGYDPERTDMRASLVLFGPTVAKGQLSNARLVDIAPTVAGWLQLPLRGVDGKPLQAHPSGVGAPGLPLAIRP